MPATGCSTIDLQILVNGLWESGAEAISINGHRLSEPDGDPRCRGRDHRGLPLADPAVRIEAIGDQRTLPASFARSAAGAWWNDLAQNRRMTFEISGVDELTLAADPGMVLRYARPSR